MASEEAPNPMAESGVTIPSDSEHYSAAEDISPSTASSSSPAVILYQPPTFWSIVRGATINLFLPFINGMMMGFGELFAHEAAFRLGWSGTRVCSRFVCAQAVNEAAANSRQVFPLSRRQAHPIGPGIEAVDKPRRRVRLDDLTSME